MNADQESFKKDLDELIRILKQIKANVNDPRFDHLDPMMKQSIDFVITNYENIKDHISVQMLDSMGIQFHQIIRQFLEIMKSDLGEGYDFENQLSETSKKPTTYESPSLPDAIDIDERIKLIDDMLKRPGLNDEAIDKLLDERNHLLSLHRGGTE